MAKRSPGDIELRDAIIAILLVLGVVFFLGAALGAITILLF